MSTTTSYRPRTVRRNADEPRVWIGCLACYNEGFLVGQWYDGIEAGEITTHRLHQDGGRVLTGLPGDDAYRWSPDNDHDDAPIAWVDEYHEELWIFDHEGYSGAITGECSPAEAQRVAELLMEVDDDEREPFGIYLAHSGAKVDADAIEGFRDAYQGVHDSEIAYAQHLAEETDAVPKDLCWPASCIDWDQAARELFMDHWSERGSEGDLYIFASI